MLENLNKNLNENLKSKRFSVERYEPGPLTGVPNAVPNFAAFAWILERRDMFWRKGKRIERFGDFEK